ncbi:MAG: aminotransferase class V-fold PLP-dependent enzyme [Gemmatimonadales bacterium]
MTTLSRRRFAHLVALSGSALLLPDRAAALAELGLRDGPLPPTPREPDEKFWREVRSRFVLPRDFGFFNAANLCPTSLPVLEALERNTRALDADPSSATRARLGQGREAARRLLAEFLGATPEEIVITRNTSEANNLVSSGIGLGPNDEVVVFGDNHPSNLAAWQEKAKRFGFAVTVVPQVNPHPGPEYYLDAFTKALTPRTRVLAVTQVTNSVGDALPVAELCRLARERNVLSLVDGAQSFGVLEVRLDRLGADLYSGSAHQWLCGPKETGVLYVNRAIQDRIWPSVVSLYPGAVGISRKLEGMGQRDEAALAALGEAVTFQTGIGRSAIEHRSRELARRLREGLRSFTDVTVWTHADPARSAGIVAFQAGSLDPRRLSTALYEKHRIAVAARGGTDRPGLRLSPHLYNTMDEVERVLSAVRAYLKSGV